MAPVILAALASSGDAAAAVSTAMTHLHTLVRSPELDPDAKKYSEMICDLVRGESASTVLKKAGLLDRLDPASDDKKTVYKTFGPACNIDQSMPVSAHFLLKCAPNSAHSCPVCRRCSATQFPKHTLYAYPQAYSSGFFVLPPKKLPWSNSPLLYTSAAILAAY